MIIGVDVGGTFTDLVWWDGQSIRTNKTSTTPADQSRGVEDGIQPLLSGGPARSMLHGTTVATNALLERTGEPVALLTDPGFEDLIEIGRQSRPSLYDPFADRPPPLVDRAQRIAWQEQQSEKIAAQLSKQAIKDVAVSRLYSYREPEKETELARSLSEADPELRISLSHQVAAEFREYERTNTTVVNAYLGETVRNYLSQLTRKVVPKYTERMMVMRSSGGLIPPSVAARLSASILLSGPAGGVVAAAQLGESLGKAKLISFDMGGTSTDVCWIEDGRPEIHYERDIAGQVIRMPSVAVHTVGAGGGSIGWVDAGGALRVGPQSAGAVPGPACYGRGGKQPTVTDANLILGRLGTANPLARTVELDQAAAQAATVSLGKALGWSSSQVATGMIEVVETRMERALRAVSVEEGYDPRPAYLVGFGGAGGSHATALAKRLSMTGVLIPPYAGVFSALGLLLSPPRHDVSRSVLLTEADRDQLDRQTQLIFEQAQEGLAEETGTLPEQTESIVEVRYLGQAHETAIPYLIGAGWDTLSGLFHQAHHNRNGFSRPEDPIEVVTIRGAAMGKPALTWSDLPHLDPSGTKAKPAERRLVQTGGGRSEEIDVWWRPSLSPGDQLIGPAMVEEPQATTYIGPGEQGQVLPEGTLEISW